MRVNKKLLDIVEAETDFERIICCALYLNVKSKAGEIGGSIHEQVALEVLRGNYVIETIARVTHFEETIVKDAICDIANYCAARR
jgi:hypothetical protein